MKNSVGMLICSVIALVFAVTAGASTAHTWGDDITPAAGDVVVIPAGATATIADATTYGKVKDLSRIKFADESSRIVFDVPAGETWTVQCTIRGDVPATTSGEIARAAYNGGLVKRGGGDLEFTIGSHTEDFEYFVYTPITVEAGAVVMPQNYADPTYKKQCLCGPITVSNGAYFVASRITGNKANISYGVTYTPELWGEGTVSNRLVDQRFVVNGKRTTSEFSGTIGRNVRYYQTGYANLMGNTTGSASTTMVGDGGVIGVKIFGSGSSAASIPKGNLDFASAGTFRYLGAGETTSKNVVTRDVYSTGPAIFDGGTNGALVLSGKFAPADLTSAQAGYMHLLAFDGDHPNPCELSGSLSSWTNSAGLPATYTVAKRGIGTWKFSNDTTPWSGALFVENGTLQATSIGNIGEACSLGYATNRTAFALNVPAGSSSLPYAICLGSAETAGTLEYTGASRVDVTNRPIALTGMGGGITNASSSAVAWRGVSALAEGADAKFTVSANAGTDNIIADVSDGAGKVSLVKDGNGCWTLAGNNDFTGTLSVNAGTLYVEDPTRYTWFRWILKGRWDESPNDSNVRVVELGIYDADGRRINGGLKDSSSYSCLRPGSLEAGACALDKAGTLHNVIVGNTFPLDAMFDDGTRTDGYQKQANVAVKAPGASSATMLYYADPSTWIPVVMHLTNGASRAVSFDIVQADNSTNTGRYFKEFGLEGSVDGVHWNSLTNVTVTALEKNKWVGSGTSYSAGSAGTHTGGIPISGGPDGAVPALSGVESVSVAEGARLVSRGGGTIRGLTIDMNGAGTIENFSFAENGTLNVVNPPKDSGVLPGAFVNCSGIGNISGWGVKIDGSPTDKCFIRIRGDRIYIVRRGFVLVYR